MNVPETFFNAHEQLILFGISCIFGVLLGICYDVFRTVRMIFPHNSIIVFIEDVLFLCGYAAFVMLFAAAEMRGEVRFYNVLGNILGFTVYICTVGNIVTAVVRKLCGIISSALRIIMRPAVSVYVFICEKVGVKFVGNSKILSENIKIFKNLLLKRVRLMYNKKEIKNRRNVSGVGQKKQKSKTENKKTFQRRSR